jgi:hypothetical protein
MGEEELKLDLEEVVEEEPVELSEVEEEATLHGWKSEGVEGKRTLSAEEFMDRQPLYDDAKAMKKQIKRLQEGMDALKTHQGKVRVDERAKVVAELQQAKVRALEEDNYEAVVQIDDKIAETRADAAADVLEPVTNGAFEDWEAANSWYNQDPEMKEYADMIGNGYAAQNPNKDLSEVYDRVTSEVKKRYAKKFSNPASNASSPVEAAHRGGRTSSKLRKSDLPEQDRRIMDSIIRAGGITEAEYLKEYAELGS